MADVKYIKFGDSGAPQIKVDASLSDEEIRDLLKSEKIETAMAEKGFAYKYGLDPVYLLDEDNLNDNSFVAGAKSSIDTLKQIGPGAMATIYDAFGAETLQQQAMLCRANAIEYDTEQGDYSFFGCPDGQGNYYRPYKPFHALYREWQL